MNSCKEASKLIKLVIRGVTKLLRVFSFEGLFRFKVTTEGTDRTHLVDLSSNNGLGECGCWDFISPRKGRPSRKMLIQGIIAEGKELEQDLWDENLNCKHMLAARKYQHMELHWHLIDENPHGDDKT